MTFTPQPIAAIVPFTAPFVTELRVRHYEMDALGHVNNAVYQHYLEQAAIEHSEALGFSPERYRELGGVFVMRRVAIDYLRPAVAGDLLLVSTWLSEMRGARAIRRYEIRRSAQAIAGTQSASAPTHAGELLVTAEALWVWIDPLSLRPRPIPEAILGGFAADAPSLP